MRYPKEGVWWSLVATLALASVWALLPGTSPPLYDGLALPVEAYRYETPPVHYTHRVAPDSVSATLPVIRGPSPGQYLGTRERPPQAILSLDVGAFRVPSGITHLQLLVRPVPPPAPSTDGPFDGNVYLVAVRADGRLLPVAQPSNVLVELRRTGQGGGAVMEQFMKGRWKHIHYSYFANSVYVTANPTSLGYFALVRTRNVRGGTGGATGGTHDLLPFALIGGSVILLVLAGIGAVRLSRRSRTSDGDEPAEDHELNTAESRSQTGNAGRVLLIIALGLLALVWQFGTQSVPLYDGLGLPPAPYRYLTPPSDQIAAGLQPTSALVRVPVVGKSSPIGYAVTHERPPQAILSIDSNAMVLTGGSTSLLMSIRPVPPPGRPLDGALDGNAYLFSVRDDRGTELQVKSSSGVQVQLRKTGSERGEVLEQFVGGRWIRRPFFFFLNAGFVSSNVRSLGYFALVLPGHGKGSVDHGGGTSTATFVMIGAAFVVIILLGLFGLRLARGGRTDDTSTELG